MIGKAAARHGSTVISSPSANFRMWSWHVAVPRDGPWAWPLIIMEQDPQIPSRQSWSNATGSRPSAASRSFKTSNISRNDMSGLMSAMSCSSNEPGTSGPAWRHTRSLRCIDDPLLIAALGELDVVEGQRLLVEHGRRSDALELPRAHVREVLVVAERLALFGLMLHAEVTAAALFAVARVEAHQLGELEEVRHAPGSLE